MTSYVSRKLGIYNAEQFKEAFSEAAASSMYIFISRISPWPDEASPPAIVKSIQVTDYDVWRDMIALKRIQSADVLFAIPRYDWTNNKKYREYNISNESLFNTPASSNTFYVINNANNVYKCLFNNKGATSTVMPSGTGTSVLVTADGYHWKYMYTVDSGTANKFLTADWIPVKIITTDDGSAQFDVQQAAVEGTINVIDVVTGGNNYITNSGTVGAVSNSTVIVLAAGASGTDDTYNKSGLYISSGLGSGQVREIVNYVGSTKSATIKTAFGVSPNTSSTYLVSPLVKITGDGSGAIAYSNVSSGAINYINMISVGSEYTTANITITANSGSSATAIAFIAPPGGHGSNALYELNANNIILSVDTIGSVSNTFPVVNDFRVFGILRDPVLSANDAIATATSIDQTTRLTLSSVTGDGLFTFDETIRGNNSKASGKLVYFSNTNSSNTAGHVYLTDAYANGSFTSGEIVTGLSSSITGSISSIAGRPLKAGFGDVLYIKNHTAIERDDDQTETIKLIVKF